MILTNCPICDSILTLMDRDYYGCSSNDHYFTYDTRNDFDFMVAVFENYKQMTSCINYKDKCNIYFSGKESSVIEHESVERTKENILQKFNQSKKALSLLKVFK
jgi:hypothetical protein